MIEIGTIQSVSGYGCRVRIERSGDEVDAVLLMPFVGQATTIIQAKQGTQVAVWMSEVRSLVLGVVPSDNEQVPTDILVENILDVMKKIQVPTPSGMSGVPVPNVATEIEEIKSKEQKIWL